MTLQLGMVVLDATDLERSIAFYRLLGLDVPDPFPGRPVALHRMESGVSMVLAQGLGYQQALEFYVGDDAAVDEMWTRLTAAGHHGRMAPATTTGIYAALVDDPDGNVVLISSDPNARPDGNKELYRRFQSAMSSGDPDVISTTIDELVSPDAKVSTPLPIEASGPGLLKEVFARLVQAYPDLHIAVEDVIAEGDKVVGRNKVTGTHQGEYMGIAPTGRSVTYDEIFIFRFADRKIVETRGVVDVLAQMRAIGALSGDG